MSFRARVPFQLTGRRVASVTARPSSVQSRRLTSNWNIKSVEEARGIEKRLQLPEYLLNVPPTQVSALPNKFRVASEYR